MYMHYMTCHKELRGPPHAHRTVKQWKESQRVKEESQIANSSRCTCMVVWPVEGEDVHSHGRCGGRKAMQKDGFSRKDLLSRRGACKQRGATTGMTPLVTQATPRLALVLA